MADANAYNYLPEMQGMTDIQQRQARNQAATQQSQMNRAAMRSGGQSSGAYLGAQAQMRGNLVNQLGDIERQNQYKNALLALEDRRTREARAWQKQMADEQYKRQVEMYNRQQRDAERNMIQQMIGGAAGTLVGGITQPFVSQLGGQLQNVAMGRNWSDPTMNQMSQQALINYYNSQAGALGPYKP